LNFLVTEDYKLKLADMGEAWPVGAPPRRENPPMPARHWCPPEVLEVGAKADSYTKASDVFGVCVVISEILLAELPYGDTPPDRMSQAAWLHQLSVEKLRPDLPDLEKSLEDSIRAGWATNPADRPSAADLLAEIEALTGAPGTFSAY
ncbi:kinase-like domain-containing protein, partial [Ochromonadaceae sp. CCMP2298]